MRGVDDAVRIANDTDCGLAGAVWSRDADRLPRGRPDAARHRLDQRLPPVVPQAEWGGYGRSGIGRERGVGGLDEYRRTRHIWQNTRPAPQHWLVLLMSSGLVDSL